MNRSEADDWQEPIDRSKPSAARMYDLLLGGNRNYPSDRRAVEELLKTAPSSRELALNNRAFLIRVVRHIAKTYGIRQFIDHGSGLPTQSNVHEVAEAVHPDARVVYVDNDPMVLGYGRAVLDESPNAVILNADMADTPSIVAGLKDKIDLAGPVAALFVSVLHCIPDRDNGDPKSIIERTVDLLAPGSVVVVSQLVSDNAIVRDTVTKLMQQQTGGKWGRVRTEADVRDFFNVDRLVVEPPGLVDVTDWHPDAHAPARQASWEWIEFGGLARVV
ncbi:SAM-dependent methyltransferase [Kitasatospora sp. NPDC059827]|uniref:SAM-dependent methyltransferase n=1 Tax=Kitasatospora sp. NPDC059827 TaxID=3346964 RepID=UPI00366A48FD